MESLKMKEIERSIEINAPKEKVWKTLWEDATFREWANLIDEGMFIQGDLKEGNEVEFMSSVNGYGVTSLVETFIPNEYAVFKHSADTQESGAKERENEWTGGTESYAINETDGVTTLTVKSEVPQHQEETFSANLPKALERIKLLVEKK